MLPRLPLLEDVRKFWTFSKAGRKLSELHLNYEDVPAYEGVKITGEEKGNFKVEKIRFARERKEVNGKKKTVKDKSTIIFNSAITISNIPEKAYEYVVNGRSAIEWILDRYRVKTDKKSVITNDANDWAKEVGHSRYILDLLLSIINVSVQTVDIVEGLPTLEFEVD
jgi:predicted helicase